MIDNGHSYFSADYQTAHRRFVTAATAVRAELTTLPLQATAGLDNPTGIDIAWLGPRQPRRALLHVCGIHGVEGFAGSAVQLALLVAPPVLPEDTALILVHVLNPYGMTHLRRVNENNVDLNRNFFFGMDGWRGTPAGYAALDRFLNPTCPPARLAGFHLRLALAELSLGGAAIRQAVAGGQYDFPKGIFYGGSALEEGPRVYGEWLGAQLREVRELFVIDVHTGLGGYGWQSLFLRSDADAHKLEKALGLPLTVNGDQREVMGYEHAGGHSGIYRQLLPHTRTVCITEEFGTYIGRRLLHALRAENQHHHYGDGRVDHWSKRKLKAMFCPDDEKWRQLVINQGCDLVQRASHLLDAGSFSQI